MTSTPLDLASSLGLTVTQLAQRVLLNGRPVNRRTLAKWRDRGAPFNSLAALNVWISTSPLNHKLAPSITAASPHATPANAVPASATSAESAEYSPKHQADLAALRARNLTCELRQLEIDNKLKALLHRADVARMVAGLASQVVDEMADLPARLARRLGDALPQPARQALHVTITAQVAEFKSAITASVSKRLATLLEGNHV